MTQIQQSVLEVLSNCECDGAIARLSGQLNRSLYVATNKVLEALGGRWDRKMKGHVFVGDASSRIDEALLTWSYERAESFDFYPTPRALAENVIRLARIRPGMRVLEPSAGDGALADVALGAVEGSSCDVWDFACFEIRPDLREKLLAKGYAVDECRDFLAAHDLPPFDRIVMNPPFSKQQDIDHVTAALRLLSHNGILVAIVSLGVTFRENRKTTEFRELIESRGGTITPNPGGSFRLSGTDVNTVTVAIAP